MATISGNRVESDLQAWKTKEASLNQLFEAKLTSNKAFLKEKLAEYQRISNQYRKTENPEERRTIKMLQGERKHLEKQLFPNLLARIFYRLFYRDLRDDIVSVIRHKNTERTTARLSQALSAAGIKHQTAELRQNVIYNEKEMNFSNAYYKNESEYLEHQVTVARGHDGKYELTGMLCSLKNERNPELNKQHFFSAKDFPDLTTTEAYNLLCGRAVQRSGKWLQLDLTDKDQNGNYRLKEFLPDYGFDLQQTLNTSPYRELLAEGLSNSKMADLMRGERVPVSITINDVKQQHYIEANPQFKSVNILNGNLKKTNISALTGLKQGAKIVPMKGLNEQNATINRSMRTN